MPLYEYECTACHKRTEKIQKFSDPEITVCPKCGGVLERVISAPAISFKGGGWYADGYGNAKPAANGGGSDTPGKDSGGKSSGGSESKPATDTSSGASAPAAAPAAVSAAASTSSSPAASSSDKS